MRVNSRILLIISILILNSGIGLAQSNENTDLTISSIQELKRGIDSSSIQTIMADINSWFPAIVSNTPWNTQISDHYIIHHYIEKHDENDCMFDSLLVESEKIYNELNQFFDIDANTKQEILAQKTRLLCFIFKIESNITFGFLNDPHTFFFYLDTKQTPEYMEKFRHEYAHWVWGRSFGEAPSFLWEGLATYAEKMSSPQSNISDLFDSNIILETIPPLQDCVKNEVFWGQKGMYSAGSLFVHFLVENWGWDKLKALFLTTDFEDREINKHFYRLYGSDLKTLDKEWRSFITTRLEGKIS